ncbi:MAG: hypothetical protein LBL84_01450, partial [Candidatus Nomurabacteria bacterium]|nr:hypothetical protein [Candidatus Nomurabacteria bacterium]
LRTLHSGEEVPTGGIDDEYAVIYTSLATPEQNMFLLTHGYWGEDFAQRHERDLRRVLGDLYEGSKWDVDQQ